MEVRDPIHGAIELDDAETAVADHEWTQRLRNIRQVGFSHLPFPGATHTRYAHSLGVLHLAGRAFDRAYRDWHFDRPESRQRFRTAVRLAALLHDIGHAPLSHCMEFSMPALSALNPGWYRSGVRTERRASHEDYTIAILEHTDLGACIAAHCEVEARHVAAVISTEVRTADDFFMDGGLNHRRLLSQIVSSELDADRLDYLVRDATFSGARYGQVDVSWLIGNLAAHAADGGVSLALDSQALYAFDHFLIARHHMFLMVYFHHKSVIFEEHLRRYINSEASTWSITGDLAEYLHIDDVALMEHLRKATHAEARRVTEKRPYKRVLERHGSPREADLTSEGEMLHAAGIDVISASSTGRLSRYNIFGRKRRQAPPIYVIDRSPGGRVRPLADASQVFERYADDRRICRLYVAPEDHARAEALIMSRVRVP